MIKTYFSEQHCAVTQPTGNWLARAQVRVGRIPLYKQASQQSMQVSQMVFGEHFDCYQADELEGLEHWYLVQSQRDAYVGYIYQPDGILEGQSDFCFEGNAKVNTLTTALYMKPTVTAPIIQELPFGAELCIPHEAVAAAEKDQDYYFLPSLGAWVYKQHVQLNHRPHTDPVALARQFIGLSYLWGGRSGWGVDCSSLVQLCFEQSACLLPRDSALQQQYAPAFQDQPIARQDIRANDLLFWPGHVAIASSNSTLIHATGHGMRVIEESIDQVCQRIYQAYQTHCMILRPLYASRVSSD
ncbi:NlpC/P60 family protein [Marinomonas pollencensis]|uniref:NlpC/P60 family protein n=1 Tax=Marinomonas pollencensis TaxID=491954 RepID=A0A3E0DTX0_9GAMM|nr:NlpC/P60 family protein [Marinomonas pollencensis]REG84928.1 NlpC/P60 family protein [Marinomonas pollencensis]